MAKSARKPWAGLTVVTQDAGDLLATGSARPSSPTPPPRSCSARRPRPSTGRRRVRALGRGAAAAASARRGEGLLAAGPSSRVAFQALASPAEHYLCTSDPAEIARIESGQTRRPRPTWRPARQRRRRTGRPAAMTLSSARPAPTRPCPAGRPGGPLPGQPRRRPPATSRRRCSPPLPHYGRCRAAVAAAIAGLLAGRAQLRRRQHAAFAADARLVTSWPRRRPARTGRPRCGPTWSGCCARPGPGGWHGQPHLGWE